LSTGSTDHHSRPGGPRWHRAAGRDTLARPTSGTLLNDRVPPATRPTTGSPRPPTRPGPPALLFFPHPHLPAGRHRPIPGPPTVSHGLGAADRPTVDRGSAKPASDPPRGATGAPAAGPRAAPGPGGGRGRRVAPAVTRRRCPAVSRRRVRP